MAQTGVVLTTHYEVVFLPALLLAEVCVGVLLEQLSLHVWRGLVLERKEERTL